MPLSTPKPFNATDYLVHRWVARGDGARTALVYQGGRMSYADVAGRVHAAAAGLAALGVRPEERVMFFAADSPELVVGILGAMHLGAVAVPVSTMLTEEDLAGLLVDSRARLLVTSAQFVDTARGAVAAVVKSRAEPDGPAADLKAVLTIGASPSDFAVPAGGWPEPTGLGVDRSAVPTQGWPGSTGLGVDRPAVPAGGWPEPTGLGADRSAVPAGGWPEPTGLGADRSVPVYPTWADSPALWLYTSGTTGSPKAAMHRHGSIRYVCETYGRQVLGIRPDDVCFSVAKLFFAYGIGNSLFFPFSVGAAAVLEPGRPTPELVAEVVGKYRPTLFFGVPTFYSSMLHSGIDPGAFRSVRQGASAGEPLPASLFIRVRDRFGFEVLDGIGSTEALHIFVSNRPGEVRPGTSGVPVPGYQVQLRDELDGSVITEPDRPGALYVCGESIASGYWCRARTTRQAFQGEWLRTGDTYQRDAGGVYRYLGRSDDMIKAGGIWVSPSEVEARLLEHPDVLEVAVVAVPDESGLDKPVAAAVVRPGSGVEEAQLVEFCRAGLAAFKRPRRVVLVDSLPKTATGKLQRYLVRGMLGG